ncbi:amidohydrolase/deacetylase family metallohydrolase [Limobrevibacterium gyesilva]|uniref:Amidohydrolase/deacetylase family metallohydrolase n=1 Tax=Limobrevibacterium gyesilva TaxID=2991712 RepID=A0AA41YSD9_9PROT|nr:amidohydrolase/deacetylase family metallohydrolase [Limobrevibacterium gyesilva]MCW3475645.1 amidohydrolase/deacetylase family metallohydrolase [Limobrevibacterium gyesilva]
MFDLVLQGGRVIDPAQNLNEALDVAFAGGKVAAIGKDLGPAAETRDVSGKMVVPGLIDLHTHVYWGGTSLGVDPDDYARFSGCTTLVDAGSAGPGNIHGFRKHVIERSDVRILPFLNIAFPGIFGLHWEVSFGECSDLRLVNSRVCLAVAKEQADLIVGIKVRVGGGTSGALGIVPMQMALEVAEHMGLPLMSHLDAPPPPRSEVMKLMRGGDILTHCFRPFPNAPAAADGSVEQDVLDARARGVIFDIGHGRGSFGFETAMAMLKNGFLPDVISSDVHLTSIGGPAYNMLVTMSKFLRMGVPLNEVIRASTINAASAVRVQDRGTLKPGLLGDATILEMERGKFTFMDVVGETLDSDEQLACRGIVLGGKWWHG